MDGLVEKTIKTSRGLTYRYYITPASEASSQQAPVMLHHGFPDTAVLWSRMIPTLSQMPNRLIIPDLLGYGGTSKPTNPAAYAYHLMVRDLLDILDAEGIEKVVSLGHDHGVGSAVRFYNHAPDRTTGMILMNVAYRPPDKENPFDIDAVNAMATQAFGYPMFNYWYLFTASDGPKVLGENLDRLWEAVNANTFEDMRDLFGKPGAMRAYLTNRSIPSIDIKPYAHDAKLRDDWIAGRKENGFEAPVCWYLALLEGVQFESDKLVPDENYEVNVPLLYIGCSDDAVCRPEMAEQPRAAGLTPDLTVKILEGVAHWPMYEKPEDAAKLITDFIQKKGF